jgi:hypothetical protein
MWYLKAVVKWPGKSPINMQSSLWISPRSSPNSNDMKQLWKR